MKCPKCHTEMVTKNYEGIEVDRCPSCEGIFLDPGELEHIDSKNLGQLMDMPKDPDDAMDVMDGMPAFCHKCENSMMKLKGAGDITFDWCDKCEGMFFDRGELAAMDVFEA